MYHSLILTSIQVCANKDPIINTTGTETINFDLVKEFYVNDDILFIVQIGDENDRNWFRQSSAEEALELERRLNVVLKSTLLVNVKSLTGLAGSEIPKVSIRPTV